MAQLVETLRYEPEDRVFDFRWYLNPSGRTMVLGSTQPLIEMSTSNISRRVGVGVRTTGA